MAAPVFYFDFNSPYAYLAAKRIDDVLPVAADWRPISFGHVLRHLGRVPWSLTEQREPGIAEIARRAAERGLPPPRYPAGWPAQIHSLAPMRAAYVAGEGDGMRALSLALFDVLFVEERPLGDPQALRDAAVTAGLDPDAIIAGIEREDIKGRVREATDEAIARGVTGVPTVAVGDELFWGDDRLEDAAAALSR